MDVALNQRTQALISVETQLLTAEQDAKVTVIQAQATADGMIAAANAQAQAIEVFTKDNLFRIILIVG